MYALGRPQRLRGKREEYTLTKAMKSGRSSGTGVRKKLKHKITRSLREGIGFYSPDQLFLGPPPSPCPSPRWCHGSASFQLILQLPVTGSQPCLAACHVRAANGHCHHPWLCPPCPRDAAHQGGHGHPLGPPVAWLPGAKGHLVLTAPQQGCKNSDLKMLHPISL